MSYNSSLDRLGLNYKNSEDILGINVLGYSHTGELVLDNLSNSSLLKETNKKRNKISYLLHKKYLNTREYFIKTNYKNYPAYVQLVLSQMYFSYLSSNNKKIPLLSKPVHYKKDINDKLLINNIKSSYSKLQNYLIFKRSNIKSGITKIIKSKNRFKLLNRTKYFLFEKKSISLGSLNKSRAKKRQMFNINSLITFRGKHQYNKKTLKRFEKLSFSNFIN
jgi:hypothetical protein